MNIAQMLGTVQLPDKNRFKGIRITDSWQADQEIVERLASYENKTLILTGRICGASPKDESMLTEKVEPNPYDTRKGSEVRYLWRTMFCAVEGSPVHVLDLLEYMDANPILWASKFSNTFERKQTCILQSIANSVGRHVIRREEFIYFEQ